LHSQNFVVHHFGGDALNDLRFERHTSLQWIIDDYIKYCADNGKIGFVTGDFAVYNFCRMTGIEAELIHRESPPEYTGVIDLAGDNELAESFYLDLKDNKPGCLHNQYVDVDGGSEVYRWDNKEGFVRVKRRFFQSGYFGRVEPKDAYQTMVFDSIMRNQITAITGPAGSGKTLISLAAAMSLIENKKYEKLTILFNPTKAKGAVDTGFIPGDAFDKAMCSSVGNMLITKFGDLDLIRQMVSAGTLSLVNMADCRGMEISGKEILYITECQNTSVDLLKLALERGGDGAKVIIEGDYDSQVDSGLYENKKNGLVRAIDVFKGSDIFGCVKLKSIYRGEVSRLASLM